MEGRHLFALAVYEKLALTVGSSINYGTVTSVY